MSDSAVRAAASPPLGSVTSGELEDGFERAGLRPGDVALVHSAMRTLGHVPGGAPSVVEALLAVLGPDGTLVAPTFTFAHEAEDDPVIDPALDPSEMGAVSEAVRRDPRALRSTAYRHSFAAIGPRAAEITRVDPSLAVFDLRSAFGAMLRLGAQVVLVGVPYASSTSHHFAEWVCEVPYRHTVPRDVRIRQPDGSLVPATLTDYQPRPSEDGSYYGTRGTDFNRLGSMLEERGLAGVTTVGNAVVRRFRMPDLIELARDEASRDHNVFRTPEGQTEYITPLRDGHLVLGPEVLDGAGRPDRHLWSVEKRARV